MVRPVPQPAKNEVLIRVAAAGVNRPDILQRRGAYPPPAGASDIPGLEVSGEVVAVGSEADQMIIGERVCALLPRSEEHTSELQSLMRISYAVFCLKKKKKN